MSLIKPFEYGINKLDYPFSIESVTRGNQKLPTRIESIIKKDNSVIVRVNISSRLSKTTGEYTFNDDKDIDILQKVVLGTLSPYDGAHIYQCNENYEYNDITLFCATSYGHEEMMSEEKKCVFYAK